MMFSGNETSSSDAPISLDLHLYFFTLLVVACVIGIALVTAWIGFGTLVSGHTYKKHKEKKDLSSKDMGWGKERNFYFVTLPLEIVSVTSVCMPLSFIRFNFR